MAIKIFAVDNEDELRSVIKILEEKGTEFTMVAQSDYLRRLNEDNEENTLERAILIAKTYVEDFLPFTYHDIGCGEKRGYREEFRKWASENNIEFSQARIPGQTGFRGMLFQPFKIDETGNKVLAQYPEEIDFSQRVS